MVHLGELPVDVLFYVVSKMQIQDTWSLTAVSHTFRELSTDRSFWLTALKTHPSIQSVSNPSSIHDLDLQDLKQLALHSLKLDHNWALPCPRIIGEVRKRQLGDRSALETNNLCQFPGSELFIFHSSKLLKCFDYGTGEYTSLLDLDAYIRCASYDFLPDKSVILGLALKGGSRFDIPVLKFVKIQRERNNPGIAASLLLEVTLAKHSDFQKPFVSSRIVGAAQSNRNVTEILAYDVISGGHTVIETDIPTNYAVSRRLTFSFHNDDLLLLADDGHKALVYCCPRNSLPFGQTSTTTSILTFGDMDPISFPTRIWKRRGPVCTQMLRDGSFVKVHDSLGIPDSKFATTVRFWRRADLGATLCPEITVDGMCSTELTMQMGPTGHNVVASLLNLGEKGCTLVLIRFNPDSNSCTSHELELPVGVGSGPPPSLLAIDDHRGVVWLIEAGVLFSVPYA
ncbi:F-box domain-containing protein [Mycena venus]|uniref:F-box domain-containing protein n=1 Tax=Mycena venus TaxID=2733690 RepID=A0A8H7D871_9AGAR|nr:F-box domain-containing protein [Mycena venus]